METENQVTSPFWGAVGTTWENSEGLQKALKPINGTLKIVDKATGGVFAPLKILITQIGMYIGLIDGLNWLNRTVEFIGDDNGKLKVQSYSIAKLLKTIFLGIGHAMEGVKFLEDQVGLFTLGKVTADVTFCLGSFCPWLVVKDVFIMGSSVFGIVDSARNKLPKINKDIKNRDLKLKKWTDRTGMSGAELSKLYKDKITQLEKKTSERLVPHKEKFRQMEAKLKKMKAEPVTKKQEQACDKLEKSMMDFKRSIQAGLKPVGDRLQKWEEYSEAFAASYTDGMEKKIEEKKEFWTKKVEVMKKNAPLEKSKVWMSIANDIGKLVIIIVAMIAVFTGMIIVPWCAIAVTAVGVAANSIGFAKFIHEKIVDKMATPEPLKPFYTPVLPPLPAAASAA